MSSPTAELRPPRQVFDIEGHAFFLTFSCYRRLSLLGRDRCKRMVLGTLDAVSWRHQVGVVGYCVMPNHMHALVRPVRAGTLSVFMQQWKRLTSAAIQQFLRLGQPDDFSPFGKYVRDGAGVVHVWQPKYYAFNVFTPAKAIEKLEYMHNNPVRAGLVDDPCAWPWSTAAHFLQGRRVPVRLVPMDGPVVWEHQMRKGAQARR
jgi:putative transposase